MKKWKWRPGKSAALASACLLALGADFTWTGEGNSPGWDVTANWGGGSEYPDGTDDNATIPYDETTTPTVELVNEQIGDLTLLGSVDFDAVSGTPELAVAGVIEIDATQQEIVITVSSGATITTCP